MCGRLSTRAWSDSMWDFFDAQALPGEEVEAIARRDLRRGLDERLPDEEARAATEAWSSSALIGSKATWVSVTGWREHHPNMHWTG